MKIFEFESSLGGNSSFSGWILAALTKDLENLALVTHDISIHTIVMRLVRIVETQDVCLLHFPTALCRSNPFFFSDYCIVAI